MEKKYNLLMLTPDKKIFEDEIVSLVAPSELGYLGILANHAPLVTTLTKGNIIIRDKNESTLTFQTEGGFLEVNGNKAVIVSENIKR